MGARTVAIYSRTRHYWQQSESTSEPSRRNLMFKEVVCNPDPVRFFVDCLCVDSNSNLCE